MYFRALGYSQPALSSLLPALTDTVLRAPQKKKGQDERTLVFAPSTGLKGIASSFHDFIVCYCDFFLPVQTAALSPLEDE